MKKFYLFAAIAALFAVSCTTDMTKDVECLPIGENQIFVSFEEQSDTRIQLNEECKTVWTKGDLISVFEKNRANACWRYIGATGKRNGAFIPKSSASSTQSLDKVVVVYPYNENYTISADKRIVTTLPAEQLYHTGSYSVGDNLMVSQSDDRNFVLKSVCGWLKFQFVGTGVITKIEFSGNNYEQIAGKVRVDCTDASLALIEDMLEDPTTDDGEVGGTLIDPEDYVTTVALNCGEEGVALNSDTVTDFYLILPPQTFESGITVKVTCADGTVVEKSTKSPLTISRNAIQPMTALTINGKPAEPASNEIWYTNGSTTEHTTPSFLNSFGGATIQSNTYDANKGCWVITFDGNVTEIGNTAFMECQGLTSITIPDSVTMIGDNAFLYCPNLAEFKGKFASKDGRCLIVDGVLKSFAPFGITTYNIPDSVTEIGYYAFQRCGELTSITIPDSVTKILGYPFIGCDSLVEFKGKFVAEDGRCLIVDGVLKSFAPAGLLSYTIPDSVTEIGDSAFAACFGLTSIIISDSVTVIEGHAFVGCSGLTSVTIPDGVTEIGDMAFYDCDGLTSVFCERTTPPTADFYDDSWDAFYSNASDRKIYVPAESVYAYKEAEGWNEYVNSIVPYDFEAGEEVMPSENHCIYYRSNMTGGWDSGMNNYRATRSYIYCSGAYGAVVEMKFKLNTLAQYESVYLGCGGNRAKDNCDEFEVNSSGLSLYTSTSSDSYSKSWKWTELGVNYTDLITLRLSTVDNTLTINGKSFDCGEDLIMPSFSYLFSEYFREYDEGEWKEYDGVPDGSELYYVKVYTADGDLQYLGYASKAINPETNTLEHCWYAINSQGKTIYNFANDAVNQGGYTGNF